MHDRRPVDTISLDVCLRIACVVPRPGRSVQEKMDRDGINKPDWTLFHALKFVFSLAFASVHSEPVSRRNKGGDITTRESVDSGIVCRSRRRNELCVHKAFSV